MQDYSLPADPGLGRAMEGQWHVILRVCFPLSSEQGHGMVLWVFKASCFYPENAQEH